MIMRTLVTGASGFLGAAVATALVDRGDEVAVLIRRDIGATRLAPISGKITAIVGDLLSPETYADALRGFAPDAVVHCGWWGVDGADRNEIMQLHNLVATGALVETAISAGATIVLGIGSQAEYGSVPGPAHEDTPARPTTLYGITKLAAGQAWLRIAGERGVRGVWGRCYSLYGPGDNGSWLIPSLIRSFRAGHPLDMTAGEQVWEYLHVVDAANAIAALLETPSAAGVFNIGAGTTVRLRNVVEMIRDLVSSTVTPRFGSVPYRPDQVMHLQADISRLIATTGWRPQIALYDGLRQTVLSMNAR
jgi:nucleoside-diphosphate-sugar epimerase